MPVRVVPVLPRDVILGDLVLVRERVAGRRVDEDVVALALRGHVKAVRVQVGGLVRQLIHVGDLQVVTAVQLQRGPRDPRVVGPGAHVPAPDAHDAALGSEGDREAPVLRANHRRLLEGLAGDGISAERSLGGGHREPDRQGACRDGGHDHQRGECALPHALA